MPTSDRIELNPGRVPSPADTNAYVAMLERELAKERDDRQRLNLALAAAGSVGTWYGDLKRGIVYGDENFARIYGVDPLEASAGKPLGHYYSMMHPDDVAGANAARDAMRAGSDDYVHEHRILRVDGSILWVMARGRIDRDADGDPMRFTGVSVDITERKRAEQRDAFLLELEARLRASPDPRDVMRAAAEHLGLYLAADRAGYAAIDPTGELATVDLDWTAPGVMSLSGQHQIAQFGTLLVETLKAGHVGTVGDTFQSQLIQSEHSAAAYAAIDTRATITVPLIRRGRLVAVFYVHQRNPRLWSPADESICRDVAERTWSAVERAAAERAALDTAIEFQMLSQAMTNHVWTATPDGHLTWLNSQVSTYSGVDPGALTGTGWVDLVHPDDLPGVLALWEASLASGDLYETEFRIRRHDGVYRWHLVRAVAVRSDGRIIRWIGTNTDIEDQKTTARALADLAATLEQQVETRTAELMAAEETLRQSQKMEAVGQLTGGLAHDFNNLLAGISGSLDLLRARVAQGRFGELSRYIDMAQGAAERAAALTHRLLAFSRRQTLDPKPTDMNRLVVGLADFLRRTVGPSIELEIVTSPQLWTTNVDRNQLENAVLNLCINARDAMPDGGRIRIETANHVLDAFAAAESNLDAGAYVALVVEDTGAGMSPEVLSRAFDPFFTTKPLGAGTGLGLSMVYGFVRQSGGQATIQSKVGQGTRISLFLPGTPGLVDHIDTAPETGAEPRAQDGETVLVVDDEPNIRTLVTDALVELGYAALQAPDGERALKLLETKRPIDLLVTDVGLPGGINGRQLADLALTSRPDLKVLFITGYAETAVAGNGAMPPGMHVMTKPFGIQTLACRIRDIIAG